MIRITELALPLDHSEQALPQAIAEKLGVQVSELQAIKVFKRSYDARKKNSEIKFVYIIDVSLDNESEILARLSKDKHVKASPDTHYYPVEPAPKAMQERPIVIGFGPCGLFAALILAQQGYKPIVLERGKNVRARTKDTCYVQEEH